MVKILFGRDTNVSHLQLIHKEVVVIIVKIMKTQN